MIATYQREDVQVVHYGLAFHLHIEYALAFGFPIQLYHLQRDVVLAVVHWEFIGEVAPTL